VVCGVVLLLTTAIGGVGLLKVSQMGSDMDQVLSANEINVALAKREVDYLR